MCLQCWNHCVERRTTKTNVAIRDPPVWTRPPGVSANSYLRAACSRMDETGLIVRWLIGYRARGVSDGLPRNKEAGSGLRFVSESDVTLVSIWTSKVRTKWLFGVKWVSEKSCKWKLSLLRVCFGVGLVVSIKKMSDGNPQ